MTTKSIKTNDVQLKNGIMVFSSLYDLDESANDLNLSNESLRAAFVDRTGFRSQKDIFDQIIHDEDKYEQQYLQVPESELKKMNPDLAHSQLYLDMRAKGIIKEFKEGDGMSYDYAICDPMYASVINEDGFVAVGDTVYYVDSEKVVCWKNADFNNLSTLKSVTETDTISGIYVIHSKSLKRSTPADEVWQEIAYADGYRDGKKYKYAMHLHFQILTWMGTAPGAGRAEGSIEYKYYISLKSKKKKPLGGYKYRASQMEFSGIVHGKAQVYPLGESVSNVMTVTNQCPEYYKGGVANSIARLNFFGPVNSDGYWDWESTHILSFSRGTEKLYYHTINNSYAYYGYFEENVNVSMSGNINIVASNHSVTY